MINSPSLDLLIRLKNAYLAGKKQIVVPSSKFKVSLLELLKKSNLIDSLSVKSEAGKSAVTVKLLYVDKVPAFKEVKIYSRPGRRIYERADSLPWGVSNTSLIIVSTNKGVMSQRLAQKQNLGGEIIAQLY